MENSGVPPGSEKLTLPLPVVVPFPVSSESRAYLKCFFAYVNFCALLCQRGRSLKGAVGSFVCVVFVAEFISAVCFFV